MLIKIGNNIYDSSKQPICIRFFKDELVELAVMKKKGHDIYTKYPNTLTKKEVKDFKQPLLDAINKSDNYVRGLEQENARLRTQLPEGVIPFPPKAEELEGEAENGVEED